MMKTLRLLAALTGLATGLGLGQESPPDPVIDRKLPPPGIEIPADLRTQLEARLEKFLDDAWGAGNHPLEPDVAANIAQVPILACISPPGNQEIHWAIAA